MRSYTKLSIAVLCAFGITAVTAQTVQRDGKVVQPAQTRAPVQTAQAGAAAAGGAVGGTTATGAAVMSAGTLSLVSLGTVAVVGATGSGDGAVTHNP
jgi:hypothetical protein